MTKLKFQSIKSADMSQNVSRKKNSLKMIGNKEEKEDHAEPINIAMTLTDKTPK